MYTSEKSQIVLVRAESELSEEIEQKSDLNYGDFHLIIPENFKYPARLITLPETLENQAELGCSSVLATEESNAGAEIALKYLIVIFCFL